MTSKKRKALVITTIVSLSILLLLLLGFLIAVLLSGNNSIITVPGNQISPDVGPDEQAEHVRLHYETPTDNKSFVVLNMLPGDSLMSDYTVSVAHKEDVILYFNAFPVKEEAILANVLNIRVELRDTDTIIYNGVLADMPEKIPVQLKADPEGETKAHVRFRITASLDTSVGNEYQRETLQTTFKWWVEDTDALYYPYENDKFIEVENIPLWLIIVLIVLAALSLAGIIAVAIMSYQVKKALRPTDPPTGSL